MFCFKLTASVPSTPVDEFNGFEKNKIMINSQRQWQSSIRRGSWRGGGGSGCCPPGRPRPWLCVGLSYSYVKICDNYVDKDM